MDKVKEYAKWLVRWAIGNTAWDFFKRVAGLILPLVRPIRDFVMGLLNVSNVLAAAIIFAAVLGVLSILKPPAIWAWNEARERRHSRATSDGQEITLRPAIAQTYVERGYIYQVLLFVENSSNAEITDCYAGLEQARYLDRTDQPPIKVYGDDSVHLRWNDSLLSSDDCKITIPPRSKTVGVLVATYDGDRPRFSVCQRGKSAVMEVQGKYLIRIRIDGKIRGQDMNPLIFEGSIRYEHAKEPLFVREDWTHEERFKEIARAE
jgi:hypothetical protein